jgi:hypothetical protein
MKVLIISSNIRGTVYRSVYSRPQISDPYKRMGAILASNNLKNTVFDIGIK